MNHLRKFAAAAALATVAALGAGGAAKALPAGATNIAPPAGAESSEAATPVYHRQRRCWPVHRWVWTHWGWRYRYVGTRCAPAYHYGPYYRPYYRY